MRIMEPTSAMFILWIYAATAWGSYIGPLSPGWYEYKRYYTAEECITWRDEWVRPQLKDGDRAICLPDDPAIGYPRPFAVLLEES